MGMGHIEPKQGEEGTVSIRRFLCWLHTEISLLNLLQSEVQYGDSVCVGFNSGATGLQCSDLWVSTDWSFASRQWFKILIYQSASKAEWAKRAVLILLIVFTINKHIGFPEPQKKTYASVSWWHRLIIKCLWIYGQFMTKSIWL